MEAELWRKIEKLYHAAIDLRPSDRQALLEAASDSTEVRREVLSLLEQSESGCSPLDRPAWEVPYPSNDPAQTTSFVLSPGTLVGPYRIESALDRTELRVRWAREEWA